MITACRKCPKCNFFYDLSHSSCEICGKDIESSEVEIIDTDNIPDDQVGAIESNIQVYVQTCPACGAKNYSVDNKVERCYSCMNSRIASYEPRKCNWNTDDTVTGIDSSTTCSDNNQGNLSARVLSDINGGSNSDILNFATIHNNISASINNAYTSNSNVSGNVVSNTVGVHTFDDEEDDEDVPKWEDWLGKAIDPRRGERRKVAVMPQQPMTPQQPMLSQKPMTPQQLVMPQNPVQPQDSVSENTGKKITLLAVNYGQCIFTIDGTKESSYLLGRDANQKEFLNNDRRIGNEHCFIKYTDNRWYVVDNHSANGTFVNNRDIGDRGTKELADGDILKLGHDEDSLSFKVVIK